MLCELRVHQLLLIEALELRLEPGFNVLTGETGAGKSVLIGALKLVLGGKATAEQVRPGATEAHVEALFDLAGRPDLVSRLEQGGFPCNGELVVRRVILPSGRSRAYLNGRLCSAAELLALAPELADIASQHESVRLTDPSTHLGYLDSFGQLTGARDRLAAQVRELQAAHRKLAELRAAAQDRAARESFLSFQLKAIDELDPHAGEMDELRAERSKLRGASKLGQVARAAADRLSEGDTSICDELRTIVADLRQATTMDEALNEPMALVDGALTSLQEAGRFLGRYAEVVHDDPARLDEIEDRLYRLEQLLRQHGPTLEDLLQARTRLQQQIAELGNLDDTVRELEQSVEQQLQRAGREALELSERRKQAAARLADAISAELQGLGMGGARVQVVVDELEGAPSELSFQGARLTPDGIDRVELLIAPNKGIDPRPLRRIASGGELSRALLAVKRVLAAQGPAGLYVFDEVDTGVGGAIAECIGQALADIASHRQVLCITHLAPIAALADAHFVVEKSQGGEVATTRIGRVQGQDRVREVARMLSGARITQASLNAASEMMRSPG